MNEEDNVILSIERVGEGSSVKFSPEDERDVFAVSLAIFQLMRNCPEIKFHIDMISDFAKNDKNFMTMLEKSVVDIPDFNKILKN